jgi:hypothetical protein
MRPSPEVRAAEEKLRHWEADSRDEAVREAAGAGLSIAHIQRISGLGATTIMGILNKPPHLAGVAWT